MFFRTLSCAVGGALLSGAIADAQVVHTPHDHIPNFAASPTIRSAGPGSWSTPATWTPARVPVGSDVVSIAHAVTYDTMTGDAAVIGIEAGGALRFTIGHSTALSVGTLLVLPGGALEVGTPAAPVPASVTAQIIIKDLPLNAAADPDQYGTGLVSIDGDVTLYGAVKSPTFVRTALEPRAGHSTLTLERPVAGWRIGDRIFLPDTRQVPADHWFNPGYVLHVEERTIQSLSADGRVIALSAPLAFDHRGARDADGTPTVVGGTVALLPHVGNLTRNVVIRSENPSGTRGHTLFTSRSRVAIHHVQFQDLGRTRATALHSSSNHIGRYPLHIHHLWGPVNPSNTGFQFEIVGNAVNDSLKWPIAVHGSHYGLVRRNVVFGGAQLTGAGIAVEDGTETENLFEENFVANIRGQINPRESGPATADGTTPGSAAECFWAAGFNSRFVNNVASSCRNPVQQIVSGPGWKFIVPAAPYTARNPRFRGADMTDAAQTIAVTPQQQPILEFRGNEVYGLAADGLTAWQLGTDGYGIMPPGMGESLIKDFRVWHTYEGAIFNYPAHRMTVDGLVYRVDPAATQYWPSAFQCGDYRNVDVTIRNGSIHAGGIFGGCTDPLGLYRVEGVEAVARGHAFSFETPATPGTGADRPPSGVTMVLRNNRIRAWPGRPLQTIEMLHNMSRGNSQPADKYEVQVFDYQGQPGLNFRVYFRQQATQNLYGGIAPCADTTSRPEIDGITCPMAGTSLSAPTGFRVIR
jgi:G8 domain